MLAAQNGHTATVDLLLIRGAAIEAKDGDGWTALIWAAARGNTETVVPVLQTAMRQRLVCFGASLRRYSPDLHADVTLA